MPVFWKVVPLAGLVCVGAAGIALVLAVWVGVEVAVGVAVAASATLEELTGVPWYWFLAVAPLSGKSKPSTASAPVKGTATRLQLP